jgi:hypothetical protein
MPGYRVEAWIFHEGDGCEDELESRIADLFSGDGLWLRGGPVVFRLFHAGDQLPDVDRR